MKINVTILLVGFLLTLSCSIEETNTNYNSLAFNHLSLKQYDSAEHYANLTLLNSEIPSDIYYAYFVIGWSEQMKGNLISAMENYKNALQYIPDDKKEDQQRSNILLNIGIILKQYNHFDLAENYFIDALKYSREEKKNRILFNMGNSYMKAGRLDEAAEVYIESLELSVEDLAYQAKLHNTIGLLYFHMGLNEKSREYLFELEISDYPNKERYIADAYHNIANTYLEDSNFKKAEEYFLKSMEVPNRSTKDKFLTYQDFGNLKITLGEKEEGVKLLSKAEELLSELPQNEEYFILYKQLALVHSDEHLKNKYIDSYGLNVDQFISSQKEILNLANYNFLKLRMNEFEIARENNKINTISNRLVVLSILLGILIASLIALTYRKSRIRQLRIKKRLSKGESRFQG